MCTAFMVKHANKHPYISPDCVLAKKLEKVHNVPVGDDNSG